MEGNKRKTDEAEDGPMSKRSNNSEYGRNDENTDDSDGVSCDESNEDDSGDDENESGDVDSDDDNDDDDDNDEDDESEEDTGSSDEADDGNCDQNVTKDEDEAADAVKFEGCTAGSDSDASNGESERCPICLSRFIGQDIGNPETCDHTFCLECIKEWSKNVNTCPVDRLIFHLIFARHEVGGNIIKRIKCDNRTLQVDVDEEPFEEDNTYCQICRQCDREDRMLLCDGCDLGYHMECLTPPLMDVPVQEWFCTICAQENQQELAATVDVDFNEIDDLMMDREPSAFTRQRSQRRQIARTTIAERVRARIQQRRSLSRRNRIILSDSASDPEDTLYNLTTVIDETVAAAEANTLTDAVFALPSSSSTTRARSTSKKRGRRSFRRRKTTKKRTSTKTSGTTKSKTKRKPTKRRKRGKRRLKGRRKSKLKRQTSLTPKSRIARSLGLSKPPAGRMIPTVSEMRRRKDTNDFVASDLNAVQPLSIFGSDLDPLIEIEAPNEPCSGPSKEPCYGQSLTKTGKYSQCALLSRRSIGQPVVRSNLSPKKVQKASSGTAQNTPCDILGSILACQEILGMKSKDMKVDKNGFIKQIPSKGSSMLTGFVYPVTLHENKSPTAENSDVSISPDGTSSEKPPVEGTSALVLQSEDIEGKVSSTSPDLEHSDHKPAETVIPLDETVEAGIVAENKEHCSVKDGAGSSQECKSEKLNVMDKHIRESAWNVKNDTMLLSTCTSGLYSDDDSDAEKKERDNCRRLQSLLPHTSKAAKICGNESLADNVNDNDSVGNASSTENDINVESRVDISLSESGTCVEKIKLADDPGYDGNNEDSNGEVCKGKERIIETIQDVRIVEMRDNNAAERDSPKMPISEFSRIPKRQHHSPDEDEIEIIAVHPGRAAHHRVNSKDSGRDSIKSDKKDRSHDKKERNYRSKGSNEDDNEEMVWVEKDVSKSDDRGVRNKHKHRRSNSVDKSSDRTRKSRDQSHEYGQRERSPSKDKRRRSRSRDHSGRRRHRDSRERSNERTSRKRARRDKRSHSRSPERRRVRNDNRQRKRDKFGRDIPPERRASPDRRTSPVRRPTPDRRTSPDSAYNPPPDSSYDSQKQNSGRRSFPRQISVVQPCVPDSSGFIQSSYDINTDHSTEKNLVQIQSIDNAMDSVVEKNEIDDNDDMDITYDPAEPTDAESPPVFHEVENTRNSVLVSLPHMDRRHPPPVLSPLVTGDPFAHSRDRFPPPGDRFPIPSNQFAVQRGHPFHNERFPPPGDRFHGPHSDHFPMPGERLPLHGEPHIDIRQPPPPLLPGMLPSPHGINLPPGPPPPPRPPLGILNSGMGGNLRQQHLLINPMYLNRPMAFGRMGLPSGARFQLQVGPGGMLHNRLVVPVNPGLLPPASVPNGMLENMELQDTMPGQPPPPPMFPPPPRDQESHGGHPLQLAAMSGPPPPPPSLQPQHPGMHYHQERISPVSLHSPIKSHGQILFTQPPRQLLHEVHPLFPHGSLHNPPAPHQVVKLPQSPPHPAPHGYDKPKSPASQYNSSELKAMPSRSSTLQGLIASLKGESVTEDNINSSGRSVFKQSERSEAIKQSQSHSAAAQNLPIDINKLLSSQATLAALSKLAPSIPVEKKEDAFKVPLPPRKSNSVDGKTGTAKSSASNVAMEMIKASAQQKQAIMASHKHGSQKPQVTGGKTVSFDKKDSDLEIIDMDETSPIEDTEFSFSPPPLQDDGTGIGNKSKKMVKNRDDVSKLPAKKKKEKGKENSVKGKSEESIIQAFKKPAKKQDTSDKLHSKKDPDWVALRKDDLIKQPATDSKGNKFIHKLNRQERVIEEVKLAIKPHYASRKISKEEYKEILRKTVPKICHSKHGDINPVKIAEFVNTYVTKLRQMKKWDIKKDVTSSSSISSTASALPTSTSGGKTKSKKIKL